MKINWKLRLKNRTTLLAILVAAVALVYRVLGLFGAVPAVPESQVTELCGMGIDILVLLGVVTDPTTRGICDSERALGYDRPAGRCGEGKN